MTRTMADTYVKSITGALQSLGLHERVKVWAEEHNEGTNYIVFVKYPGREVVMSESDAAHGFNDALRMVKQLQ